jgi:hypothetical protein
METAIASTFDRSLDLTQVARTLRQRSWTTRRHFSPEIHGASDGATLEEQLSALVEAGHPDAYCFTCLGIALQLPASAVRNAAQLIVMRDGFRVQHRKCFHCGHAEPTLVLDRDA